jgi:hypothetical protein
MHSERNLHDLIGMIYDGSTDSRSWNRFLARLAHLCGAARAAIVFNDSRRHGHGFSAQFEMDPESLRLYLHHYGSVDVWFRHKHANSAIGLVVTSPMRFLLVPPGPLQQGFRSESKQKALKE